VLFEGKRAEQYASYAKRAAAAATDGELRAISAERRIEDLYKVLYMADHVGEEFEATVSSITSFGMFCTLDNTCEGLIPISEIDGVYTFDERNLTLRSRHKTYRIADIITVRLEEANVVRGKLRFSVLNTSN
jgi:ribonuclease R